MRSSSARSTGCRGRSKADTAFAPHAKHFQEPIPLFPARAPKIPVYRAVPSFFISLSFNGGWGRKLGQCVRLTVNGRRADRLLCLQGRLVDGHQKFSPPWFGSAPSYLACQSASSACWSQASKRCVLPAAMQAKPMLAAPSVPRLATGGSASFVAACGPGAGNSLPRYRAATVPTLLHQTRTLGPFTAWPVPSVRLAMRKALEERTSTRRAAQCSAPSSSPTRSMPTPRSCC